MAAERIVTRPLKVDFHIHSAASSHRDGAKVSENTIDNIGVLVEKLDENGVNFAAITDHDCFDYDLYQAFVSQAGSSEVIRKVLPGIEFSVAFPSDENEQRIVHIITLFDDTDPKKIEALGNAIPMKDGKPDYDCPSSFSESKYWEIIKKVGADVVLIAHQKNSLTSGRAKSNDANSLGESAFNDFQFMDYFEAYEYKNRRNELYNKAYNYTAEERERVRFITGTDCHVWGCYPKCDEHDDSMPQPSYLKCLPTFRGLALAVTDSTRIKAVDSFFSASPHIQSEILLTIGGEKLAIPLSPGINAIIGDNSIGKSLLVNALTGYKKTNPKVKGGYAKYLKSLGVTIDSVIPDEAFFQFDEQGSIRATFENIRDGKPDAQTILATHFPKPVSSAEYYAYGCQQIELFCDAVEASCQFADLMGGMGSFPIPAKYMDEPPESITISGKVETVDTSKNKKLVDDLREILALIVKARETDKDMLTDEDMDDAAIASSAIERIIGRHAAVILRAELDNNIGNAVNTASSGIKRKLTKTTTDRQKERAALTTNKDNAANKLAMTVGASRRIREHEIDFESKSVQPNVNPVGDLLFVSRLQAEEISPGIIRKVLKSVLVANKTIDATAINYEYLAEIIKGYPSNDPRKPTVILRERMKEALKNELSAANAIVRDGDDLMTELSQGFNARMYFTLLSDSSIGDGVYIVDQPEDQISQKAIHETVLDEFKKIGEARQVLLITHNPQFIVNLDVDNVICLSMKGNELCIQSGALEYECKEYSMLNVVADNIEGGLDTIRRRMKRYEKAD